MITRRRSAVAALFGVLVLVLASCSGVPDTSAPRVIRPVPIEGAGTGVAATTPAPGTQPQVLISNFLQANVLDASAQTSPRGFLTAAARRTWSDTSVTVVDEPVPGQYDAATRTVRVSARVLGTVDASGKYTASSNTQQQFFLYRVKLVNGQFRIDSLRDGLVLSESDFALYYSQHPVYYFNLGRRYLIPDPRWTSLTDPDQLANWLMAGLVGDPSDQIQNAVAAQNQTLPPQATARRISVKVGTTTRIEIPGSSQLQSATRDRLAEQVATTLTPAVPTGAMQITDGGRPVTIPDVGGTRFTADRYTALLGPPRPPPYVYFLRAGAVYNQNGVKLKGKINDGRFFLQSVALSQDEGLGTLAVAATAGRDVNEQELLVGTRSGGLRRTAVRGPLTRPAFAPGRSEVWVGDGTKLYVVTVDNDTNTQRVTAVSLPAGPPVVGRIIAVRLSPDGARLAVVVHSPGNVQQLYVGAVLRTTGQVRVDTLTQVSPTGVFVKDVAWAESVKLQAIGYNTASFDNRIYDVVTDGAEFNSQGIGNLPNSPTFLTVATNQPPWVTVNKAVWRQISSSQWVSPGPSSTTSGYAPIYLE